MSELIINSLYPLKKKGVKDIQIDEINYYANIIVKSEEDLTLAVRKNNLNAARELTGYLIEIRSPQSSGSHNTPEEELISKIREIIPEINGGDIVIIDIKRTRQKGSKIFVKWKNATQYEIKRASFVCKGDKGKYVKRLLECFPGEWIYFHDWSDDTTIRVKRCLYPILKESDILEVILDDEKNIAYVKINENAVCLNDHYQYDLSERISGRTIKIIKNNEDIPLPQQD